MKRFLKIAAIAPIIFLAACSKNSLQPDLGFNSKLKLTKIAITNYTGSNDATIQAIAKFSFLKPNDTNTAIIDTTRVTDTFYLPTTTGYDQNLIFNTPANSKYLNIDISLSISGGSASGATIDKVEMIYNDKTYLNTTLVNFNNIDNKNFALPTQTVSY